MKVSTIVHPVYQQVAFLFMLMTKQGSGFLIKEGLNYKIKSPNDEKLANYVDDQ